ncbi:para-aminobenzoate synthetase component 1 [Desulfocicer vacuolatum DSM 3385]|uniref:aminodeoxychorismate synthase n=1 Tax=Desulfocicer vacuolatum DSM 3385 TaxID=1121400 RepID=A0A1W2C2D0_9BACT|nr:aminodeoxychorismate synthase component I [Desulfocicer vacuolatum]SMC79266.1 para-aminobenzoate synthetase component 1 [Desulfocicer vacuolatum DSM 3385]
MAEKNRAIHFSVEQEAVDTSVMASLNELLKRLPQISSLERDTLSLAVSLESFATPLAARPGTVVLLSGGTMDCARYHILAAEPWLTLMCHGTQVEVTVSKESFSFSMDPFEALSTLVSFFKISSPREVFSPVMSGLFGYLSYDLKDRIEDLPRTCSPRNLPDLFLVLPSVVVVHDKLNATTELFSPVLSPGADFSHISSFIEVHRKEILAAAHDNGGQKCNKMSNDNGATLFRGTGELREDYSIDSCGFTSNFTRKSYMAAVDRILSYIRAGDIYQVNLSQRYETGFQGNAYTLFRDLYHRNPAPFFAFINAGDHQIVSTSPERFIRRAGHRLETRPIKGTLPRGKNPEEDQALARELTGSTKDDAELSMIVDLMRNDLGRVARGGSVEVMAHKRLEPYDNVFHLVSDVTAVLDNHMDAVDVIRATFPGGSITGCPKIRAMEIIDELESVQRHVYTGSLGYISFHDTMDLSIAIRTATVANGRINYSVGGGIVFDSDPEKEYEETLHKGKTLMDILMSKGCSTTPEAPLSAWVNGEIIPQDLAKLDALSPGAQYGAGLFETLRVNRGEPCFLSEHIHRFNTSWQALFHTSPPDISWKTIIDNLVDLNGLGGTVAAVKIMAALGRGPLGAASGRRDFLAVFVRPYVHRLEASQQPGLRLISYPFGRQTPLADHKTLNYLFYDRAGEYARKHHGDEALILNTDGSVSETNTCALFALEGNTLYLPTSPHVLPGVTVQKAVSFMEKQGVDVKIKKLDVHGLCAMEHVCAANALMGIVPVISIDAHTFVPATDHCRRLNYWLDDA